MELDHAMECVALKGRQQEYSTCVLATMHAVVFNVAVERKDHACRKIISAITCYCQHSWLFSFQPPPFKTLVSVSYSDVLKAVTSQFWPTVNTIMVHVRIRTTILKYRLYFKRICFSSVLLSVANRHIKCNTIVVSYIFLATFVTGNLECV